MEFSSAPKLTFEDNWKKQQSLPKDETYS